MPIENGRIIYEHECINCGYHVEDADMEPTLPLRDCPECEGGTLHHIGPPLDECDRCGAKLLYNGNSGLGRDSLCDGCYEKAKVMM